MTANKSTLVEEIQYLARIAPSRAREALGDARNTLASALAELDRCIERFEQAERLGDKADAVGGAIRHLSTYIPHNIHLDQIAYAQAGLICANTLETLK